jgi:hypothetical protein
MAKTGTYHRSSKKTKVDGYQDQCDHPRYASYSTCEQETNAVRACSDQEGEEGDARGDGVEDERVSEAFQRRRGICLVGRCCDDTSDIVADRNG